MKTVYTASKVKHARFWHDLRRLGVRVVSTWIDEAGAGQTPDYADLWVRCVTEAATADCVLLFVRDDETLKGALVEVGAALACGKPVYVVSDCCMEPGKNGSWINHPLVTHCNTMDKALEFMGYTGISYSPD